MSGENDGEADVPPDVGEADLTLFSTIARYSSRINDREIVGDERFSVLIADSVDFHTSIPNHDDINLEAVVENVTQRLIKRYADAHELEQHQVVPLYIELAPFTSIRTGQRRILPTALPAAPAPINALYDAVEGDIARRVKTTGITEYLLMTLVRPPLIFSYDFASFGSGQPFPRYWRMSDEHKPEQLAMPTYEDVHPQQVRAYLEEIFLKPLAALHCDVEAIDKKVYLQECLRLFGADAPQKYRNHIERLADSFNTLLDRELPARRMSTLLRRISHAHAKLVRTDYE